LNGRGYEDDDVFDPVERMLSSGEKVSSDHIMSEGQPFDCENSEHDATFRLSPDKTAIVGKLKTKKDGENVCSWSVTTDNHTGYLPRYFNAQMQPVDETAVPQSLREQEFPKKNSMWPFKGPYVASPKASSCLSTPGPAQDDMHCAQTSSPSWIGYRWYRFVDQPGLQHLHLSSVQKEFMQARVENLHKTLSGNDRWIKKGPLEDSDLAIVDGGQLVTPPPGLEHGYVPVVIYEGVDKPAGCADLYEYVGPPKVGGWGGLCRCPSGKTYEVGDQYDACASLACVGGVVVKACGQGVISPWKAGWKVTCEK